MYLSPVLTVEEEFCGRLSHPPCSVGPFCVDGISSSFGNVAVEAVPKLGDDGEDDAFARPDFDPDDSDSEFIAFAPMLPATSACCETLLLSDSPATCDAFNEGFADDAASLSGVFVPDAAWLDWVVDVGATEAVRPLAA